MFHGWCTLELEEDAVGNAGLVPGGTSAALTNPLRRPQKSLILDLAAGTETGMVLLPNLGPICWGGRTALPPV